MPRACRPRILAARRTVPPDTGDMTTYFWRAPKTDSGRYIDEHSALAIGAVWACVRCIGESLAVLPWRSFQFLPGGDRRNTYWHPADSLLHSRPNPYASPMTFVTTLMHHVLLWGNGYAEIERSMGGQPLALWPLDPSRMQVDALPSGEPVYVYTQRSGAQAVLASRDVFHVLGPSHDGIMGLSIVAYMRETLGLASAMESDGARFFGGGSMPDLVLKTAARLSRDVADQTLEDWNKRHSRSSGRGERTGLLHGGLEVQTLTMPHDDSQWLEGRQFAVTEIARWFRVPPHKIGDLSRATFSNIEHQSREFVSDSLMPWAERLEQEADAKLFTDDERRTHFTKFSFQAMLRGDMAARGAFYRELRTLGALNGNEIRAYEDLNSIDGGEKYTMQSGFTTLERIGEEPVEAATAPATGHVPNGEDDDGVETVMSALRPVLRDALDRCWRRWSKIAEREKTVEAAAEHVPAQAEYVRTALRPFEAAFVAAVGGEPATVAIATENAARHVATEAATDEVVDRVLTWYAAAAAMKRKEVACPA